VLGIDVRDDRVDRREVEEAAVALVGLGDQELAGAEARVRAERPHLAADDDGRVAARLAQHRADERGGRRLAVRARDGDAGLHAHQLGEHLGALDHRDLELAGAQHLGVRERDRGGDDEHVDVGVDGGGVVRAGGHLRAEALETAKGVTVGEVGAGHGIAEGQQHFGDAAHADSADPDEMHAPSGAPVHRICTVHGPQRPPCPPSQPGHVW
jgi:hypothetical protein